MNRDCYCVNMYESVIQSNKTHYLAVTTKIQGLRNQFHYITWMIVNFNSLTLTKENWLTLLLQISDTNDDSFELARSVYLQNLCLLSFWNKIILLCQCCPHIETSQLICIANQLTDFYVRATLAFNGLRYSKFVPVITYLRGIFGINLPNSLFWIFEISRVKQGTFQNFKKWTRYIFPKFHE